MKILVIGGGLIGITTAFFLNRGGHTVTVIDRREGPGLETSFANGSLLSPSLPEPWNVPGCWRVLLASLVRPDAALQLRVKTLPSLLGWGAMFLHNSSRSAFGRNAISNLRLSRYSLEVLRLLRGTDGIEYGGSPSGLLQIFRSAQRMDQAVLCANSLVPEGLDFRQLSSHETGNLEPALKPIADQLAGALHYSVDEVGDAYRFCVSLAHRARQEGVEFAFGTSVTALEVRFRAVVGVQTLAGRVTADHYVLAAGSHSPALARPLGVRLPVQPVKGYSLTFDPYPGDNPLNIPVVDGDFHAAVVPIDGALRIAGIAEFAGYDLRLRPERARRLAEVAQRMLPRANLDRSTAKSWCGLRPMTSDGVPLIGRTSIRNLWVNTGHGHLGWTMAAGSGQLLSSLVCGEPPAIQSTAYAPGRFARSGTEGTSLESPKDALG